jgi:BirA family transcriptional regulator, biotin operon repressor / biotin---[acetyl-CoA-carboxylase] ligase
MNQEGMNAEIMHHPTGRVIHWHRSIDSTNSRARQLALEGAPDGTIVAADLQTAGRGRLGRKWESPPGENLMFSIILRPRIEAPDAGIIPLITGLAVARALSETSGLPTICKWPNDVLIRGKKVCGILTESCIENGSIIALIAGIGINVNQKEFPEAIRESASSLSLLTGMTLDRLSLLSAVLEKFDSLSAYTDSSKRTEFLTLYTSSSSMFGLPVTIRHASGSVSGTATGLDNEGGLVIRDARGHESTWYAGDVTILSKGDTV